MSDASRKPARGVANPHKISTFCTSPQKNRIFPFILGVSHLRSPAPFAIVPSGPSSIRQKQGFFHSEPASIRSGRRDISGG